MVDWSLLPRGVLIGLSVAAPVGPMSVLCVRRTLSAGQFIGLVSGMGVALGDATFGSIAAFGLNSLSSVLVAHQNVIRLIGGAFLMWLGYRTVTAKVADLSAARQDGRRGYLAAAGSTLGLTLTNPLTILSFAAIFAGFGFADRKRGGPSAALLVAGVFTGSMLWWIVLTSAVALLCRRLTRSRLTWVNRVSGAVILAFGAIAIFLGIT